MHLLSSILLDVAPPGGVALFSGIIIAILFVVLVIAAFVIFKLMKRTIKMGIRLAIFAVIAIIVLLGSAALLMFSQGGGTKPRPGPPTPSTTRR